MKKYCCDHPLGKPCDYVLTNFETGFPLIYIINSEYIEDDIILKIFKDIDTNTPDILYKSFKDINIISSCYYFCSMLLLEKIKGEIKNSDLHDNMIYNNFIGSIMYLISFYFGNPHDSTNEIVKLADKNLKLLQEKNKQYRKEKEYINKTIKVTEIRQNIKVRRGQNIFRKKLLQYDSKCKICGLDIPELLVASHTKNWDCCNSFERLDVFNGFLLCNQHDGIYDKGFISFNDDGSILISNTINTSQYPLLNINNKVKIVIEENHKKYLKWHRENWFIDNRKS